MKTHLLAKELLSVDIGNSKTVAVLYFRNSERARWRIDYAEQQPTRAFWLNVLRAASELTGGQVPILVASVVPKIEKVLARAAQSIGWKDFHAARWDDPWPFDLAVAQPQTLGLDRLANVAGLMSQRLRNGIAVDVGSAITVDVLRHGSYLGGVILPGFELAACALNQNTSQLPRIDLRAAPPSANSWGVPLIGTHTQEAITSGVVRGLSYGVWGIVLEMQKFLGSRTRTVLTGGQAEWLNPSRPKGARVTFEADLIHRGLRLLTLRL